MKRLSLILTIILFLLPLQVKAQSVSYTYKALKAEGCSVNYSVAHQDNNFYLVVSVTSDRMRFLSEPSIKFKTFKGEIIELTGIELGNSSQTAGVLIGNIMVPVTDIVTSAQFRISQSDLEKFQNGISKVRISLAPMNHEREFSKDKIGKKLYKIYLKLANQKDDF